MELLRPNGKALKENFAILRMTMAQASAYIFYSESATSFDFDFAFAIYFKITIHYFITTVYYEASKVSDLRTKERSCAMSALFYAMMRKIYCFAEAHTIR